MDSPGRLLELRGTRLHIYEHGDPAAPSLLYMHGGPGQGCYDFVHHQAARLGARLRLIAVDQRGTLFSDPLTDAEEVSETETVADLEAVRAALGVQRWAVLGHSFGARMALRYAVQHPETVSAALFENPVWDEARSALTQVEAALTTVAATGGDPAPAQTLLAQQPISWVQRRRLVESLGEKQTALWFHRPERLSADSLPSQALPSDLTGRGRAPAAQLLAHEQLRDPLAELLPELRIPALLLLGLYDCVTDDDTIELFNAQVDEGEVVWFEESGHFCHVEEPQTYADVVTDFVART